MKTKKTKDQIKDLLSGNKGKKGTLVASQREPGIYIVGDIEYNEIDFEALCQNYENTITFVHPDCQKLSDSNPSNLNIKVDSPETAQTLLKLRNG